MTEDVSETKAVHTASQVERIAGQFIRGPSGHASVPTALAAQLRRMEPDAPGKAYAALFPVLVAAKIALPNIEHASAADPIERWATVVHVVALLSGTAGRAVHHGGWDPGRIIRDAGYSETRFMRLLAASGPALPAQVSRLARFLSAKGAVPLNLVPLVDLVRFEGIDRARADAARRRLAQGFFTSQKADVDTTD